MKLFIVGIAVLFFTSSAFGWYDEEGEEEQIIQHKKFRPPPDAPPPLAAEIPIVEEISEPQEWRNKRQFFQKKFRPSGHGPPLAAEIPIFEENGVEWHNKRQLYQKRFQPSPLGPPLNPGIPIFEEYVFAWQPSPFGPPRYDPIPTIIEGDNEDAERKYLGNGLGNWYLGKTQKQLYNYGSVPVINLVPQTTPNNFYFYLVQNFFLNGTQADEKDGVKCREHRDCKGRKQHCYHGVCKVQLRPRPHQCKVDHDCQIKAPKGVHFHVQVYCDHGHCKIGRREDPEKQICTHYTQCINGGECRNNRCVEPEVKTTTQRTPPTPQPVTPHPFFPPFPHPHQCKADRDCQFYLPKGAISFIPVYCDRGHCQLGIPEETPEYQLCQHSSECINGGECRDHRCVSRELTPHPKHCKVDRDCEIVSVSGTAIFIPSYCDNGHCKNGSRPEVPMCIPACHHGELCIGNRCIIPPLPHPRHCKVDHDCKLKPPFGALLSIPIYCDNGHCKLGRRRDPEVHMCSVDVHCPPGEFCVEHRCISPLLPPHPRHCKVDHDCKLKTPFGAINTIPSYCDNGHCKLGRRSDPEAHMCLVDLHCPSGEVCIEHYCASPLLPPHPTPKPFPHPRHCKVDHDCKLKAPFGALIPIPVYCDNGHCKLGIRNPLVSTTTEKPLYRECNSNDDCDVGKICHKNHCIIKTRPPPAVSTTTENPFIRKCSTNADCKSAEFCYKNHCILRTITPPTLGPKTTTVSESQICQLDSDCINNGKCYENRCYYTGIPPMTKSTQKPKTTTAEVIERQVCQHDSDCINNGTCRHNRCYYTGVPIVIGPTQKPIAPVCQRDSDCGNSQCQCHDNRCLCYGILPEPECKANSDCYLHGQVCGGGRYCKDGTCRSRRFSIPTPLLITATYKPCNNDAGCYAHTMLCGIPYQCVDRQCIAVQSPVKTTTKSPVILTDATFPPLVTTKKHPQCHDDRDCRHHGIISGLIPHSYCDHGVCKSGFRPAPETCFTDNDCYYGPDPGFSGPQYCDHGKCKSGHRPAVVTTPKPGRTCHTDRECRHHRGVDPGFWGPHYCDHGVCKRGVRPKPTIIPAKTCQTDYDCEYHSVDPGFGPHEYCDQGICKLAYRTENTTTQETPEEPTTIATTKTTPAKKHCRTDRDCMPICHHPFGCIYQPPHYCKNNVCVLGYRPAVTTKKTTIEPTTIAITKTQHPEDYCRTDRDCMPGIIPIPLLPMHCENNVCKPGRRPQIPTTPKTTIEPTTTVIAKTHHPKKHCRTDRDCMPFGINPIHLVPMYCENHVCIFGSRPAITTIPEITVEPTTIATAKTTHRQKHCHTDRDCMPFGIKPAHLPHMYCENNICKHGKRPKTITTPAATNEPTSVATQQTKHPKKYCQTDRDCMPFGIKPAHLPHMYCENNVCKHGKRPKITTTTESTPTEHPTSITTAKTPRHHCHKDQDCLKYIEFQHKMLVSVYCYEGYCTLHKPPKPTKTTKTPTTTDTSDFRTCKSDKDCHRFDILHTVSRCHNHRCTLGPYYPKTTKSPVAPTTAVIPQLATTENPKVETTSVNYHFPSTCKADRDCTNPIGSDEQEEPVNYIPAYCEDNRCKVGTRASTEHPIIEVLTTVVQPEPTVEPTEVTAKPHHTTHTTRKPHPPNHCKHDSDCHSHLKPGLLPFVLPQRCIHGKCVAVPGHTTTPKPHPECKHDKDCRHHLADVGLLPESSVFRCHHGKCIVHIPQHKNTTSKPKTVKPTPHTIVHKSTHQNVTPKPTPHIYTCRRNSDCKDYPHPKNMPVYCEHRLCKHGHRRPKNDFDSCKSDSDCKNYEGPCVNGFCSRPHQH